jgi:proline iminopeptidase
MFLFLGRHDWQTPSALAAPWLDTITAPSRQVIWFEKSAHSPMVDEPDTFAKALIEQVRPVAVAAPAQ